MPAYPPPQGAWDMSWVDRVEKAKHRQVFDAPDISDGMALGHALLFINGFHEVYQTADSDVAAVLVFRHMGLPAVLNNDMWKRLGVGERTKLKDPTTGETTQRNPFVGLKPDDKTVATFNEAGMDALIARGVIVLCCNLALMRQAGQLARQENMTIEEARTAVADALVPGVIRMPSGIFAGARAQEAGCHFLRST